MFSAIREVYRASAPLRAIYHLLSITSMAAVLIGAFYFGLFDHRVWVTERVAQQYGNVEVQQQQVADLIFETVPSRANNDAAPSRQQIKNLQRALLHLSGTVTQVDNVSENMIEASDQYRSSISVLTGALVRFDPNIPTTQAALLQAVDDWDVAARTYADAVEGHIGSFSKTLPSSV